MTPLKSWFPVVQVGFGVRSGDNVELCGWRPGLGAAKMVEAGWLGLAVQQQREFRVNVRGASAPHRFPPGHGPGTGFETLFAESRQGLVLGGRLGGHVWCTLHQAGRYQPRQADKELLFQVVLEHLEDFLEMTRLQGYELPKYVLRELEDFLRCGVLANGFLRVRCNDCGGSMVVGLTALASQCSSTRL